MKTPVIPKVETGNEAIDTVSEFASGMTTPENLLATAAGTGAAKLLRGVGRSRAVSKPRPIGPKAEPFTPSPKGLTPPPETVSPKPPSASARDIYFPERVKNIRDSYVQEWTAKKPWKKSPNLKFVDESHLLKKTPKSTGKQVDVVPGTLSAKSSEQK